MDRCGPPIMPRLPAVRQYVSDNQARIYRIACDVLPGISGRVYLVLGAGPPTMVDAGSGKGNSTQQILQGIEEVGREFGEAIVPRQIERILLTHAHIDHIGGVADLVRLTGARVGVHELDSRVVAAWDERAVVFTRRLRSFFEHAGVPEPSWKGLIDSFGFTPGRVEAVPVAFLLDERQALDGMEFVHTPGHSAGHVCIRIGNVLLSGDHILARTIPQQWPESLSPNTGLGHYLDSLDKVELLEGIETCLGGHEPPVEGLGPRIESIRAAQQRKLDRVLEIVEKATNPVTIAEISRRMYPQQTGFYELLALTDVGSRVEYLEQRGRLRIANLDELQSDEDAACRYTTTMSGLARSPRTSPVVEGTPHE